jgi:NTE family protein
MHELKAIKFRNELIESGIDLKGKLKKVYLHHISADEYLSDLNLSSKFNTSWNFLNKLKERGYKACDAWLKQNLEKIGKEDTIEFPF